MALIPQEPHLFRGTIRENLSGVNDLDDGKLWTALEKIGIARWVRSLKHQGQVGLDFRLEEGAKNISQGERQLLCMARALLQDTPIIIMDEATSSVDPASEELLVRATETHMKDKTKIIVAHRLSTIENSDRVLWLDQGRLRMLDRPDLVLPEFQARAGRS
jgi:ABC-type multidrug transport system fused ATPase/permease subunit